jgi:hypothetical protein
MLALPSRDIRETLNTCTLLDFSELHTEEYTISELQTEEYAISELHTEEYAIRELHTEEYTSVNYTLKNTQLSFSKYF